MNIVCKVDYVVGRPYMYIVCKVDYVVGIPYRESL